MEHKNKNILFFDICRLCLDEPGVSVIFEINDLSKNIYTITGIEIRDSDNLPNKICKTCLDIVTNFIQLKIAASKNNEYLISLFGNCKEENAVDSTNAIEEEDTHDLKSYDPSAESEVKYLSVRKDLYDKSTTSTEVLNIKKESAAAHKDKTVRNNKNEYECNVCSKTFKTWKQYYLHQRAHNKSLLCPIDVCGKKFATKGDLEKHIRAHTGERPYQCNECDSSFTQRVTLKAHKIKIHNLPIL